MPYGNSGPCFNCKYLDPDERWDGKVYCEWLKAYIDPDYKGCSHHDTDK